MSVFVLCGRNRRLIGVFDSQEYCMAWCNESGGKEYTYFIEYFSTIDKPYLIGPGTEPDYLIVEEEILHV